MRIGTWNLDAKWTAAHAEILRDLQTDVWLLTEVHPSFELSGFDVHLTSARMKRGQAWAGIATRRPSRRRGDPHPASVAVEVAERVFCSSVLPWRGCGNGEPWRGDSVGSKTRAAVNDLLSALPARGVIWGGDWNHTLVGGYFGSSKDGREAILAAIDALGLVCPTAELPHRLAGMTSIDHIAISSEVTVGGAHRIAVSPRLSDHDAYVIDAQTS